MGLSVLGRVVVVLILGYQRLGNIGDLEATTHLSKSIKELKLLTKSRTSPWIFCLIFHKSLTIRGEIRHQQTQHGDVPTAAGSRRFIQLQTKKRRKNMGLSVNKDEN